MENERFGRTRALLGEEKFGRLQRGVGDGGWARRRGRLCVGSALARAGIGHLILVDFDIVEPSNLNRQILALHSTLGRKKRTRRRGGCVTSIPIAGLQSKICLSIGTTWNSCLISRWTWWWTPLIPFNPKCGLIEYLLQQQIPFISSMGAALKTDPSAIRLQTLNQTKNCPLARFIRKRLKRTRMRSRQSCFVFARTKWCRFPTRRCLWKTSLRTAAGNAIPWDRCRRLPAIFGLTIANQVILRLSGYK